MTIVDDCKSRLLPLRVLYLHGGYVHGPYVHGAGYACMITFRCNQTLPWPAASTLKPTPGQDGRA
jgi:hypothetical protein